MIRNVLIALALVLTTSFVLAQTPHETFSTYMNGLPLATTPLTNEPTIVLQGGVAKKVPTSSLPFPPTSISVGATPLFGGVIGDCLSVGAGFVNAQACGGGPGSNPLNWIFVTTQGAAGTDRTTSGSIATGTTGLGLQSVTGWTTGAGLWVLGGGATVNDDLTTTIATMAPVTVTLAKAAGSTVVNGVVGPLGSIASGSNILTISNAFGWAANNGVVIKGAGAAGADLNAIVQSVGSNTLSLSANASTSINNTIVAHDDTTAINTAITNALSSSVPVYFPAGNYNISSSLVTITRPLTIFGDGRETSTIWNRSTNATIFNVAYGLVGSPCCTSQYNDYHMAQALIANLSLSQPFDVSPTTGTGIQIGGGLSNLVTSGLIVDKVQFNKLFTGVQMIEPQDSNFIINSFFLGEGNTSYGLIYNSGAPSGDDWFDNLQFINAGIKIVKSDTTLFSNIKLNFGPGLVFAAATASDVQNARFNNIVFEGQTDGGAPCSLDFGSNGVNTGLQFIGGGFYFSSVNVGPTTCNYDKRGSTVFVGFRNSNDAFGIDIANGIVSDKYFNANGDAGGCKVCKVGVLNEFDATDTGGAGAPVLAVMASSTNVQGHLVYGGFGAGSARNFLGGIDAAGQSYQSVVVIPFNDGGGTLGNIQVMYPSQTVSDATTGTADGALGIKVPSIGTGMSAPLANLATVPLSNLVAVGGYAFCNFDVSGAVVNDWATFSTATAGACHDAGRARPAHGVGRIYTTSATAGSAAVIVQPF